MNLISIFIILILSAFITLIGRFGCKGLFVLLQKLLHQNIKNIIGVIAFVAVFIYSLRVGPLATLSVTGFVFLLLTSKKIKPLFKHYTYRPFALWATHLHRHGNARPSSTDTGSAIMTKEEAYQILGLEFGEDREAITLAYRRAMKKTHPDQGGSSELAVRLNLARDLLLSSHV